MTVELRSPATPPQNPSPNPKNGRECDCPPWVVRCAHPEGGMYLFLGDRKHSPWCNVMTGLDRFLVATGSLESYVPHVVDVTNSLYCTFNDYDAALAAFHEAETRLLGRDA